MRDFVGRGRQLQKRINLTVEDELFENLKALAKKEKSSIASLSHELIERALELREEMHLSKVSEERLPKKSKRVSHKDMWD